MTDVDAGAFAAEWVAAWNAHDLDRILTHYADDVVVRSPLAPKVLGDPSGIVRGKVALRAYWSHAFVKFPDLHFDLFAAYSCVDSIVIHYRSVAGLLGAEYMRFDSHGHVIEVSAHYLPESSVRHVPTLAAEDVGRLHLAL